MQFDYQHEIGTDYTIVTFKPHPVKSIALFNICDALQRISGQIQGNVSEWKFPSFVPSIVIAQVIYNTCFECGGLMGDGIAIKNGVLKTDGDRESSICYTPYVDPNNHSVIKVRKCLTCGHSHTF